MSGQAFQDVLPEMRPLVVPEVKIEDTHPRSDVSQHQNDLTNRSNSKENSDVDTNKDDDDDGDEGLPKSEDRSEPKTSGLKFFKSLSDRRKYTLMLATLCMFLSTIVYSFLGPFFSREATKKGMNLTLVGVVFGVFELVVFITSPIYGNYFVRLGPKFVFITGIIVAGTSNVLFGCLQYSPDGTPFIVLSILIRAIESMGVSAYITASLAIVSSEFKESVGLALGIVESAAGLGFMLGPTIGAGLFEAGGFGVPFYCAGCVILLNAVTVYKFLPAVDEITNKRKGSPLTLLKSPLVVVSICAVIVTMMGITSSDATLAKRLEPLDLSVGLVGVVFGVLAGVYMIMSTLMGYVSDSRNTRAPLVIVGLLIYGIGYSLTGPSFLLPFIPASSLPVLLIGLAMVGAGYGCTYVPTMKCMLIGATEMGFENNIDTYALVAGLFNSMQTFGGFLGPVVTGYLVQHYDFPIGYGVIGLCSIVVMVLLIVFFTLHEYRIRKADDGHQQNEKVDMEIAV